MLYKVVVLLMMLALVSAKLYSDTFETVSKGRHSSNNKNHNDSPKNNHVMQGKGGKGGKGKQQGNTWYIGPSPTAPSSCPAQYASLTLLLSGGTNLANGDTVVVCPAASGSSVSLAASVANNLAITAWAGAQPWSVTVSGALVFAVGSAGSSVSGLVYQGTTGGITVDDNNINIFNNQFSGFTGTAITINSVSGTTVANNQFQTTSQAVSITSATAASNNIIISGNNFQGSTGDTGFVTATVAAGDFVINDLSIVGNSVVFGEVSLTGLTTQDSFAGSWIANNNFNDNYLAGSAPFLILDTVHGVVVRQNSFSNVVTSATAVPATGTCAIQLTGSSAVNTFVGNNYANVGCLSLAATTVANSIDMGASDSSGPFLSCVEEAGSWNQYAPDVNVCS